MSQAVKLVKPCTVRWMTAVVRLLTSASVLMIIIRRSGCLTRKRRAYACLWGFKPAGMTRATAATIVHHPSPVVHTARRLHLRLPRNWQIRALCGWHSFLKERGRSTPVRGPDLWLCWSSCVVGRGQDTPSTGVGGCAGTTRSAPRTPIPWARQLKWARPRCNHRATSAGHFGKRAACARPGVARSAVGRPRSGRRWSAGVTRLNSSA
jgi:hypothetical protein